MEIFPLRYIEFGYLFNLRMKPKAAKKPTGRGQDKSFEGSLNRLEELVESLERGSVSLDEVMNLYQEGVALSKECLDHLNAAEAKLKRLSKDVKGGFELVDNNFTE